jgi:16S rRNA (cytidine1402-2'-O)-methyltransferase
MEGNLFVVATPIGNLEDITFRAVKILESADVIACEDTRVAKKLLSHYGIKGKHLISYYEPVEEEVSKKLIDILKEGKDVALITDAGTPTISDPGYRLIKKAIDTGIKVIPIPGVSAVITALSVSGLPTDKFIFLGFLPKKENQKREILERYGKLNNTIVIYESPHKLFKTLYLINELFPNADLVVAKELTKLHENFFRDKPKNIIEFLEKNKDLVKGEFVIVFFPNYEEKKSVSKEILLEQAKILKEKGLKTKEISKLLADKYDLNKKEIYKLLVESL